MSNKVGSKTLTNLKNVASRKLRNACQAGKTLTNQVTISLMLTGHFCQADKIPTGCQSDAIATLTCQKCKDNTTATVGQQQAKTNWKLSQLKPHT